MNEPLAIGVARRVVASILTYLLHTDFPKAEVTQEVYTEVRVLEGPQPLEHVVEFQFFTRDLNPRWYTEMAVLCAAIAGQESVGRPLIVSMVIYASPDHYDIHVIVHKFKFVVETASALQVLN